MANITGTFGMPAEFIKANLDVEYFNLKITSVTLRYNKLTIDTVAGTATESSWDFEPMIQSGSFYNCTINTLQSNSYYALEFLVKTESDTVGVKSSKFYLLTGSTDKMYYLIQRVVDMMYTALADREIKVDMQVAQGETTWPNWTDGLLDSLGNPIAKPVTAADLYSYLTVKTANPYVVTKTNLDGYFFVNYIPAGEVIVYAKNNAGTWKLLGYTTMDGNETTGEYTFDPTLA